MLTTTNLKLNKPDISDKYDISLFNENADIIDSSITGISNAIAGISTLMMLTNTLMTSTNSLLMSTPVLVL